MFISDSSIQDAVAGLEASSAKARLCEFLIGLRALKLAGAAEVGLAESVPEFMKALSEYTRCKPDDLDMAWEGARFFNPFGSQAGFKSNKYQSNGPSNTIHGWATQANAPFDVLPTSPKQIRRRAVSIDNIRKFLLNQGNADERPNLLHAAVWFFRFKDVARTNGSEPTIDEIQDDFIIEAGLSPDDVVALFIRDSEPAGAVSEGSDG